MSSAGNGENKNSKRAIGSYKGLIVSIVLLVCLSVIFSANFLQSSGAVDWAMGLFVSDGIIRDGSLDVDGIEALDEVPEGEVRYYINKKVTFENTYEKGNIMLQNPQSCEYALEFRFFLIEENTNEPFYTSEKLLPGQYLSGDKLDRRVSEGTHECSYIVRAYAADDTDMLIGEQSGFLTVVIED